MSNKKLKDYSTYQEYKSHQIKKTSNPRVRSRIGRKYNHRKNVFKERFEFIKQYGFLKDGWSALCLGARLGEEVEALEELGLKAIGIDLVENLPRVIQGDFMKLEYPDDSFDFIYTNSIDHAFDLVQMFQEAYRVLKHKGFFCIDVFPGEANVSEYEVYELDVLAVLNDLCDNFNFEIISLNAKLRRMYRKRNHRETQIVLRKGTQTNQEMFHQNEYCHDEENTAI